MANACVTGAEFCDAMEYQFVCIHARARVVMGPQHIVSAIRAGRTVLLDHAWMHPGCVNIKYTNLSI